MCYVFAGNRCQTETTLTIVSSECAKPLTGVRITSWRYMRIVSSSNGEYKIKACRLPLYVKLRKRGFRTMRVDVRHSTETFTLTCRGIVYNQTERSVYCKPNVYRRRPGPCHLLN